MSRSTRRRRLAHGAFPHAVRHAARAWTVPVGDLLATGLRVHAPRVAGELGRVSVPAHQLPADVVEQAHLGEGERALATRVAKLEQALTVEQERREGAERLAAEQAARTEDLRVSLRMLDGPPRPAAGKPPQRRGGGDGRPSRAELRRPTNTP